MINNHFLGITWWEATESITHSTSLLATCSHFCSSIESTTTSSLITTVVIFFSLSFLSSLPSVCFFIPMPIIFYYMAIFPTIEAFSSFFILRSISWLWSTIEFSIIMSSASTSAFVLYDKSFILCIVYICISLANLFT